MYQVKALLQQAIIALSEAGCDAPRLDAEVIFAYVLQQDRSWLYAHSDEAIAQVVAEAFERCIQRRAKREPVAYITGRREFFGLTFEVTPHVLIPRPETELLVEETLQLLKQEKPLIADVGTGSGCIAVSLALHLPGATIIATDVSVDALAVARRNAIRHGVAKRIYFIQDDLLASLNRPIDVLVSNPPYISAGELKTLAPEVRHYEPQFALTDGGSGLSIIERLLATAATVVKPGGFLLLELGAGQGVQVLSLARARCLKAGFEIKQDLAGRDRMLVGSF